MNHGSLFSGIGGFDLAASWMGWTNVFQVERDPFCRSVLSHYWPQTKRFEDVKTFDATGYSGRIDILTGGFPCQPFSTAGKRLGAADPRFLWPEFFRIIREIGPGWVVAENVLGLTNWADGVLFDACCSDLESAGFEVFPIVLPACGLKNAPHRRDRIWIVASHPEGRRVCRKPGELRPEERRPDNELSPQPFERGQVRTPADPDSGGEGQIPGGVSRAAGEVRGDEARGLPVSPCGGGSTADTYGGRGLQSLQERNPGLIDQESPRPDWEAFPSFSPVCRGDDGLPLGLDGITFPKWRRESLKAYGNAIVPGLAFELFQTLTATDGKD